MYWLRLRTCSNIKTDCFESNAQYVDTDVIVVFSFSIVRPRFSLPLSEYPTDLRHDVSQIDSSCVRIFFTVVPLQFALPPGVGVFSVVSRLAIP